MAEKPEPTAEDLESQPNLFSKPLKVLSAEQQAKTPFTSGLLRKPVDPKRIRINPDNNGVQIKKTAA
jgi:hypothetical protein